MSLFILVRREYLRERLLDDVADRGSGWGMIQVSGMIPDHFRYPGLLEGLPLVVWVSCLSAPCERSVQPANIFTVEPNDRSHP